MVAVGRDRADLGNCLVVGAGLALLFQLSDGGADGLVESALEIHRVHTSSNCLHAVTDDGVGEHGGGGGAVAGDIGSLRRDFFQHLRAHVLEAVGELDFLGDGDAVLGDRRGAEALFEHNVTTLRAERCLDGIGENVDAGQHAGAGVFGEANFFGCHDCNPSI